VRFEGRRSRGGLLLAASVVAGTLIVPSSTALAGHKDGECKLTGNGTLASGDSFTVSAQGVDFNAAGTATLTTAGGDVYELSVVSLSCRRDGGGGPGSPEGNANIGDIEGPATKNGVPGYEFAGTFHDHGEGSLRERLADDLAITILGDYSASGMLERGNIQLQAD
jgi:hypothetical protein